jgi:solute carrier family 35 protein C2
MAFKTIGVIVLPGAIAFSMVASEYLCVLVAWGRVQRCLTALSIIQRAGIVPLSIAGIFKEVSTISISAWVFGDHLTELNVIGVVIAVSGIALFTYHKYQKVISSPVPLDAHGQPIEDDGEGMDHEYALANMDNDREAPHCSFIDQGREGVKIEGDGEDHTYPPSPPREAEIEMTNEERADRRRTEFEGWNDRDWDEGDEEEEGEMEVQRLRNHREGKGRSSGGLGRSWGEWWDKEM